MIHQFTLKNLDRHNPPDELRRRLRYGLKVGEDDPISISQILTVGSLEDAIWCLRAVSDLPAIVEFARRTVVRAGRHGELTRSGKVLLTLARATRAAALASTEAEAEGDSASRKEAEEIATLVPRYAGKAAKAAEVAAVDAEGGSATEEWESGESDASPLEVESTAAAARRLVVCDLSALESRVLALSALESRVLARLAEREAQARDLVEIFG